MMWIVDYTIDYRSNAVRTETFPVGGVTGDVAQHIIKFVANNSHIKDFKVKRINKYEHGRLTPYELTLELGRISLTPQAQKAVNQFDQ